MVEDGGNQYWYDGQVGTFMALIGGVVHGAYGGQYPAVQALESGIGLVLPLGVVDMLDAEKAAAVAAPGYAPPSKLTRYEFISRFTPAERAAIMSAAKVSAEIEVFLFDLQMVPDVQLDSPQTIYAINALEAHGLIAAGRASQILGIA